jgi:tetratricopeptide (TPR) repeat protein
MLPHPGRPRAQFFAAARNRLSVAAPEVEADASEHPAIPRRIVQMRVRASAAVVVTSLALAGASLLFGCNKAAVDAQKLAKQAQERQGENPKEAAEMYQSAASMDPTNHQILAHLATLHEKQKNWQAAADTWAKAASIAEDFANYHFRQGYSLYELARKDPAHQGFDKATGPLKKAFEKDKNLADAQYYLGKCLEELDDEQGALEAYTKAIETRSDQLPYYVDLANLYLNLMFAEEGLKVAKEGQKIVPTIKFKDDNEKNEGANNWYNLALDEARASDYLGDSAGKVAALKSTRDIPNPKNLGRESEYQLALALRESGQPLDACQALVAYLGKPAGKSQESQDNHRDAEAKKFSWSCAGK